MRLEAVIAGMFGGVSDYRFLPGGGGVAAGLRGVELAGLLAGLDGVAVDLAYAYYAAESSAQLRLQWRMQVYAMGLGGERGWSVVDGKETLPRLGALSVLELLSADVCAACGGVGHVAGRACGMCCGVGRVPVSERARAEFVQVSRASWCRLWADRYALVWLYLCGVHDVVRGTIAKNSR